TGSPVLTCPVLLDHRLAPHPSFFRRRFQSCSNRRVQANGCHRASMANQSCPRRSGQGGLRHPESSEALAELTLAWAAAKASRFVPKRKARDCRRLLVSAFVRPRSRRKDDCPKESLGNALTGVKAAES